MDMPPEAGMGIAGIGMAADTDTALAVSMGIAPVAVVVIVRAVVADFEQARWWEMPRQEPGLRVLFSLFCLHNPVNPLILRILVQTKRNNLRQSQIA
jgi:hypothetical protein